MKIRFTKLATEDLERIKSYIFQDDQTAAVEVILNILNKIETILALNPACGRTGRFKGTREFVINGLPYIIPYRVKDGYFEILRVMHTSREYPRS